MFNKVILAGNLTRDIEVKYSASGLSIANTGLAVNRKFKSQTGETREEVLFVDLAFFGRTAEIANQYLKRGSKILIEGRLKLDQWTDSNGAKRSKHSITVESMQMLDSKKEGVKDSYGGRASAVEHSTSNKSTYEESMPESFPENDQDFPF